MSHFVLKKNSQKKIFTECKITYHFHKKSIFSLHIKKTLFINRDQKKKKYVKWVHTRYIAKIRPYRVATREKPEKIIAKIPPLPVAEGFFLVATLYNINKSGIQATTSTDCVFHVYAFYHPEKDATGKN